jgi:hypothetical protein
MSLERAAEVPGTGTGPVAGGAAAGGAGDAHGMLMLGDSPASPSTWAVTWPAEAVSLTYLGTFATTHPHPALNHNSLSAGGWKGGPQQSPSCPHLPQACEPEQSCVGDLLPQAVTFDN